MTRRQLLAAVTLFATSFGWFYLFHLVLLEAVFTQFAVTEREIYAIRMLFYVSITGSAIIGSILSQIVTRQRMLELWILLGVLFTALFLMVQDYTLYLVLDLLLGLSFGIGFPSCMAQIIEWTRIEERARVFGAALLTTFIYSAGIAMALSSVQLNVTELILLGVAFRAVSLIPLRLQPPERAPQKHLSWGAVFNTRGLPSYLIPWIMF
jgi:MFS family permease